MGIWRYTVKRRDERIWSGLQKPCVKNMWTEGENGRMEPKDQYFTEISIHACELNMEICYPETKNFKQNHFYICIALYIPNSFFIMYAP